MTAAPSADAATNTDGVVPPPALPADVHVATKLASQDRQRLKREMLCGLNADVYSEVHIAIIALAVVVGQRFLIPMPLAAGLFFLVPAFAGLLIWWILRCRRNRRRAAEIPGLRETSDPAVRVRIVGEPIYLEPAQRLLAGVAARGGSGASEPEHFRITHAHGPARVQWLQASVCLAVATAVLAMIATLTYTSVVTLFLNNIFISILLILAVTRAAWAFVWPTTVRVVPGRVDILRYSFMGAGRPRVHSYDLRHARILIDFTMGRVFLQWDRADFGRWLLGVVGHPMKGGRDLGLAVLAAAYSEFEPPVGPNDSIE